MSHDNRKPIGWRAGIAITVQDDVMVATLPMRGLEVFWTLDRGAQDIAMIISDYAKSDAKARAQHDQHHDSDAVMTTQYWVQYSDGSVIDGVGAYLRLSELPRELRSLFEEATTHAVVHIVSQDQ